MMDMTVAGCLRKASGVPACFLVVHLYDLRTVNNGQCGHPHAASALKKEIMSAICMMFSSYG